jgi:hypothetical protein
MLILPPGHAQEIARHRNTFRAREKWMIGGVLGALAVLAVVLIVSIGSTTKPSGHGCVSVSLAYSTGGQQVYRCGAAARALCSGVGRVGGITGNPAQVVARQCRKAGVPVPSTS